MSRITVKERFINGILESEKEALTDYLFSYCDNPLATASADLIALFADHGITENSYDYAFKVRAALSYAEKTAFFPCGLVSEQPYSVWIDVAEIEVPTENIPKSAKSEFTINGDYGYYYVGYGMFITFDPEKIAEYIGKEKED